MVISTDLSKKPTIAKPSGDPPTKLYSRDIVKGKGAKAKNGDNVTVQYVGVSVLDGRAVRRLVGPRARRFTFELGKRRWSSPAGIRASPGMRRAAAGCSSSRPTSPTDDQGQGTIGPNETLIFVIDLKKIG